MGKTARWFRDLLGGKKAGGPSVSSDSKPPKEKKKWSFVRSLIDRESGALPQPTAASEFRHGSYREDSAPVPYGDGTVDPNKHAIAVAAATAAVAEAAVAAANAAAAVVRMTSGSDRCASAPCTSWSREDSSAVKIQSAFRGYLARRALKALKGLVKLQALVRGNIVRKQTAEYLRCMQALVRLQVRARATRACVSEKQKLPNKGSQLQLGPATPEKQERVRRPSTALKRNISSKNGAAEACVERVPLHWLDSWMDDQARREKGGDKIVEVDPGKPHFSSRHGTSPFEGNNSSGAWLESPSKDSTAAQLSNPSPSSVEMQSLRFPIDEDHAFCTEDSSPHLNSASSRLGSAKKGPFTPAKSDYSVSCLSRYSDHPNYMANTESSRAKARSQSAPKQRPEFEKSSSAKRFSVYGVGDGAKTGQRSSFLQVKFASKAYPGSGRLDKLGMPMREVASSSRMSN